MTSVRLDRSWEVQRNAEGRVVLHLDENFRYGEGPDGGRFGRTSITLAEPLGQAIWASIHEQRDTVIELALADGARVASVTTAQPTEEARPVSWRALGAAVALRVAHRLLDEVRRRARGGA
ncbi:hypothetical protein [Myxococcus sp. Y35]|uniref:hypothetical protein n=1 Tax=Pseudomyxococcus flavus TaxID=3115648 RepID=UPI003CF40C9F